MAKEPRDEECRHVGTAVGIEPGVVAHSAAHLDAESRLRSITAQVCVDEAVTVVLRRYREGDSEEVVDPSGQRGRG